MSAYAIERRARAVRCSPCRCVLVAAGGSPAPAAPTSTAAAVARSSTVFPATWFAGAARDDVVPSLLRLAAGYALAPWSASGSACSSAAAGSLRALLEPVLEFLRADPAAGAGADPHAVRRHRRPMKVLVIVAGCVWPILLNTVEGVRGGRRGAGRHLPQLPDRRLARLRTFVLRAASPQIMTGAAAGAVDRASS